MNRPANPYRDEHRRLKEAGNAASNRGDYVECHRLWREAAQLKTKGVAEVERMMNARMSECCTMMGEQLRPQCVEHGWDCPDQVIRRQANGVIVLPIRDGGSSGIQVQYCPWCGTALYRIPSSDDYTRWD